MTKRLTALLFACTLLFAGCGGSKNNIEWPEGQLANMIPKISGKGYATGGDTRLSISKDDAKFSDWEKYVEECKKLGYTVDAEEDGQTYLAYNEDGYEVKVDYRSSLNQLDVECKAPVKMDDLRWPKNGLAALLPVPNAPKGKVEIDSSSQFLAYVGMNKSDMWNYQDLCYDHGFDQKASHTDDIFTAENKDGTSVRVEKDGFNTVRISVHDRKAYEKRMEESGPADAADEDEEQKDKVAAPSEEESKSAKKEEPKKEEQKKEEPKKVEPKKEDSDVLKVPQKETSTIEEPADSYEEPVKVPQKPADSSGQGNSSSSNSSSNASGVSPEFKKMVDSYEAGMRKYCDFMMDYNQKGKPVSMLKDYLEMLKEYSEMCDAADELKGKETNAEETKYFLEAQKRVNDMLTETTGETVE